MAAVELVLNTQGDLFSFWLQRETKGVVREVHALTHGALTLFPAESSAERGLHPILQMSVCTWDRAQPMEARSFLAIQCEIVTLSTAPERIQVIGECFYPHSAIRAYFARLLRKIATCWPEAQAAVAAYLAGESPAPRPMAAPPGSVRRRGGRPRDPNDDWAYSQVHGLGRRPAEVYPEWQVRIGPRFKLLADPRDSFSKAIHPKRKKPDKTEKTE